MPPLLFNVSLVAAGIFATLVLKHLKAALWWRVTGLGVSVLGMFYFYPRTPAVPLAPIRPSITQVAPASRNEEARIHLDTTPNEIAALYASKTVYQADLLTTSYKGKWLDVEGVVRETSADNDRTMTVFAYSSEKDRPRGALMGLSFSRSKFESALSALPRGAKITAICQFNKGIIGGDILLDNCELLTQQLPR